MELDDLRRQWQQPTPAEALPAMDASALAALLARGSRSPVRRMRRNVWFEIGFVTVCLLACLTMLPFTHDTLTRTLLVWLIIICLSSGIYYRRQLAVLRNLSDASGALREHVARQLSSLRGLVKLYYRATLFSLPWTLLLSLGFYVGKALARPAPFPWARFGLLAGTMLIAGALVQLGVVQVTRWYLQRLYGQHLDRLEASLCELDDDGTEPGTKSG